MSVRLSGTQSLSRTANLPDDIAFTASGWARLVVDSNDFVTLAALESATSNAGNFLRLQTDADGTSLTYFTDSGQTGAQTLTVGTDFFWAITCSGLTTAGHVGYYRAAGSTGLTTLTMAGGSRVNMTPALLRFGMTSETGAAGWNGRLWNLKTWNRALTAAELLVESYFARVMFPASINIHWPLKSDADTRDLSGNGRTATVVGTLTAEDEYGLFVPRRRIFIPASVASGATSGTAGITFGQSAAVNGVGALAGSAAITLGQSGALNGVGGLVASAAIVLAQSGALLGVGALAGTGAITFDQAGSINGGGLTGSAALTFGQSATLAATGALSGSASVTLGQSGTLDGVGALSGTSTLTFAQAATVSGVGALSASGAIAFGQSGLAAGLGTLAGSSAITFGAAATAELPAGALAGLAGFSLSASGTLSGIGELIGSAGIVFGATLRSAVEDEDHYVEYAAQRRKREARSKLKHPLAEAEIALLLAML